MGHPGFQSLADAIAALAGDVAYRALLDSVLAQTALYIAQGAVNDRPEISFLQATQNVNLDPGQQGIVDFE